jgi:hypothetical protein
MRPFAKVIPYWNHEAPLDYNFQKLVEGDDKYDDKEKDNNEPLEPKGLLSSSFFDYPIRWQIVHFLPSRRDRLTF